MSGPDARNRLAVALVVVSMLVFGCDSKREERSQQTCLSENEGKRQDDDIAISLQGSLWLIPNQPGFHFYRLGGPERFRDHAMRELKTLLARQPKTSVVECLIIDTYSQAGGSCVEYENAFLFYARDMSDADRNYLKWLGFVSVDEQQWKEMRPWMKEAASRKPKAPVEWISDYESVVVISFYDGKFWRIEPWFYWDRLVRDINYRHRYVQERDLLATDVAIARLICLAKDLTGRELLFNDTANGILIDYEFGIIPEINSTN